MATSPDAAKPPTKTEILNNIANATALEPKQVGAVLDALAAEIRRSLGDEGPGVFALPGIIKIEKKLVPERPAKSGVPNPFKPGELRDVPAKPAYNKLTLRPLKTLKDMVLEESAEGSADESEE